jgi:hypothetical protein
MLIIMNVGNLPSLESTGDIQVLFREGDVYLWSKIERRPRRKEGQVIRPTDEANSGRPLARYSDTPRPMIITQGSFWRGDPEFESDYVRNPGQEKSIVRKNGKVPLDDYSHCLVKGVEDQFASADIYPSAGFGRLARRVDFVDLNRRQSAGAPIPSGKEKGKKDIGQRMMAGDDLFLDDHLRHPECDKGFGKTKFYEREKCLEDDTLPLDRNTDINRDKRNKLAVRDGSMLPNQIIDENFSSNF